MTFNLLRTKFCLALLYEISFLLVRRAIDYENLLLKSSIFFLKTVGAAKEAFFKNQSNQVSAEMHIHNPNTEVRIKGKSPLLKIGCLSLYF